MHMNPVVSHVTIHHCVSSHLNTSSVFSSPSPGGTRCPLPRNPLGASSPCCRGLPSSSQHSRGAFACLLLWHGNLHTTIGCLTCVQGQVLKSTSWQKLFNLACACHRHLQGKGVWRRIHVRCVRESMSRLRRRPVTTGNLSTAISRAVHLLCNSLAPPKCFARCMDVP